MSAEAEAATLGAAMLSDRAADVMLDRISPAMWTREAHRLVAEAVGKVRADGVTADAVAVGDLLGARLDEVGGAGALYDLTASAPGTASVDRWCESIIADHRRRRIDSVAAQLRADLYDADDLDDLIETTIGELTSTSDGGRTVDTGLLLERFGQRVRHGSPTAGWKMPWQQLSWWRLPDDGLTVVTGLPGSGKSTWLDVVVADLVRTQDAQVAFFSPEMAPADHHLFELVRTCMGADPQKDPGKAEGWARWLTGRCRWIDDDRDSTPGAVLSQARRLAMQGTNVLVVDPYNNLEPDSSHGDRQDLYIQGLLRRLRRFARAAQVAVVVVAHPRKTEKIHGTEGVFRVPLAGDISGGQEWWNHADAIVSVWRNQTGEEVAVHGQPWEVRVTVSKVRFAKWGRMGQAQLRFDDYARRYE